VEVFSCGDEDTGRTRLRSFALEMEARREPYGYAGEANPDPIVLMPEAGRVAVIDPGVEVVRNL
jgi:hypothetical protein